MTENAKIAEDYSRAWMARDLDAAMRHVADDVVLDAPPGRIEGAAAYREFLERFLGLMTAGTITEIYANESGAAVHYVTETKPVAVSRGSDRLVIEDGLIREVTTIFDRLPFSQAKGETATDRE
ncbi:nuclear transport factor 2 family protein [Catenuloplanes japonicus]|uniref:nuclear transport factor 2 family protein n=1 Tax=Catenuloplanes japonicus TaxID=33876 RepID=UPI000525C6FC|nr:nuclear transport factor 2 family protein [Catenuloplanes japonicus]